MKVVVTAMTTIIEKSAGEMICRSSPTFRMTSSTSPGAFTSANRQRLAPREPPGADADGRDHEFAGHGHPDNDAGGEPEVHAVDQAAAGA